MVPISFFLFLCFRLIINQIFINSNNDLITSVSTITFFMWRSEKIVGCDIYRLFLSLIYNNQQWKLKRKEMSLFSVPCAEFSSYLPLVTSAKPALLAKQILHWVSPRKRSSTSVDFVTGICVLHGFLVTETARNCCQYCWKR